MSNRRLFTVLTGALIWLYLTLGYQGDDGYGHVYPGFNVSGHEDVI